MHSRSDHDAQKYGCSLRPSVGSSATSGMSWAIVLACVCIACLTMATAAGAQTESILYSFANPPDAYGPQSSLVVDSAGNMYGTTFSGGANNLGAVFMVTPNGTESVIYSFTGQPDGSHPIAGLFRDPKTGNLYGTTVYGGTTNNGTVFSVTPGGVEKVLYSFKGAPDGANPYSSVVRAGMTIYGTTYNGGAHGYGTVFRLASNGKETVLHDFNSAFPTLDGSYPYAGLVLYKGLFYGTTTMGGTSNLGTVFSISKSGTYNSLYSFLGNPADGQYPYGSASFDKSGNLYGTTLGGGADNAGTVYKLGKGSDVILHHFARTGGDGINPYAGLLFLKGNFYGTAEGGNLNGGVIFEVTPGGTETVLHAFSVGPDGYNPYSNLVVGASKALYGTTLNGGTSKLGTVFKLVP